MYIHPSFHTHGINECKKKCKPWMKKDRNLGICSNRNEYGGHYAKWNTPPMKHKLWVTSLTFGIYKRQTQKQRWELSLPSSRKLKESGDAKWPTAKNSTCPRNSLQKENHFHWILANIYLASTIIESNLLSKHERTWRGYWWSITNNYPLLIIRVFPPLQQAILPP